MAKSVSDSSKKLVIVESPTKAKTIRKFLGEEFVVESCMGHIRDLPRSAKDIPAEFRKKAWANLGVNVEKNFEPIYCVPSDKQKIVKQLKEQLKQATELFLATDEDREGESISWHLSEVLKPKVPVKRMVFNEITREAILKSLKATREIDLNLVKAQEARRILDRLVGYTISPLLWKKVAYGLSAGRVQSVAVRLICEKEEERLRFKKSNYWGLTAYLHKDGVDFEARLLSLSPHPDKRRVATGRDFDGTTGQLLPGKDVLVLSEDQAELSCVSLKSGKWVVSEVEEKPISRKPAAPFITSTLQQEANRKMGLSSKETMQIAQKLYEQGFITYMRTDSTFLSDEALRAARSSILEKYGKDYLPPQPRSYAAKKVKGAQEAHEAIRPAGNVFVAPAETKLAGAQLNLYELIWTRTVASQMMDSRQRQVSVKLLAGGEATFSASGMTIEFPGFLRAYVEGSDDPEASLSQREVRLPNLVVKDQVRLQELEATDHETKPPARFTEASLVQMMEKEGIGRPSTYASIISTIIDRGYVRKGGSALMPTFTAMVVAKLLAKHLPQFVDLGFTSGMEKSLDVIADGDLDSEEYLEKVYLGNTGLRALVERQEKKIDPDEARSIVLSGLDGYVFRVGKYGAYVCRQQDGVEISASLPETESPADITAEVAEKLIALKTNRADALGRDPKTGLSVYALTGRYGPYVQLGDLKEPTDKPKRASLPPGRLVEDVTLQEALDLLSLPKTLGLHPVTGKEIKVGLGRFGPFVVHEGDYRSVPKSENLFTVTLARAVEILSEPKRGHGRGTILRELGRHTVTGFPVQILSGPYGAYIRSGKVNVSLPGGMKVETITLEEAKRLVEEKTAGSSTPLEGETGGGPLKTGVETGKMAKTTKEVALTKPLSLSHPKGVGSLSRAAQLKLLK